ncbi:hypothetical protein Glove_346g172 [Diversispora epigaea]|uniref:Protein kinase domain-containing protein n=1 Tax=Diversispora epigaea TaxID=1348612 RepID=A0A397HFU0_9GLOM|nr:hypothetical protein Glove_346g172 [Diversispora epigaea]
MTKIFFTRKLDGSNKYIKCIKCNRRRINSSHICYYCYGMNSLIANSGNNNIDNFIKGTHSLSKSIKDSFLQWVPFEEFKDVKKIGQGGFSQIFKATWKIFEGISDKGKVKRPKLEREIVLKVLNNSQNVDIEFLNELKHTFQFRSLTNRIIECYGVTQDPQTKNYAFILKYMPNGDLHHFIHKNFEKFIWESKIYFLYSIVAGIKKIHDQQIIHRDLHSGNILAKKNINDIDLYSNNNNTVISDLGFSQPANIDSNISRESQIYGIIPYMAPELFKNQPYSYASDIYSLGMIMWQMTSGHRPFHDQEHGPKLILDILDGKRPEITDDTPEWWANLMKKCWHPDPSQRPTMPNGDLHHFIHKNFEKFIWESKIYFLYSIVAGIKKIHDQQIIHRDLHSGNILAKKNINDIDLYSNNNNTVISDLGFSQPANIDSNISRESQIYGIIPYMAPELFKNQPYSYASDIYSLGMIMWQMTSGHRPFHDQEHGPKLILDILDGKRPEITDDTPEWWANLMKKCWHPDPSQRPTIQEIGELFNEFLDFLHWEEDEVKKYSPGRYDIWLEFKKAEDKRLEMVEYKKPFVKNPGYEHPNSRYYSTSLNSMLQSINSTGSDLFSNDHFDIMDFNPDQKNNFENSDHNLRAENSKKHFLNELLEEEIIEDQGDFKF